MNTNTKIMIAVLTALTVLAIVAVNRQPEVDVQQTCAELNNCTLEQLKVLKDATIEEKQENLKTIEALEAEKNKAELNVQSLDTKLKNIEEAKNEKW